MPYVSDEELAQLQAAQTDAAQGTQDTPDGDEGAPTNQTETTTGEGQLLGAGGASELVRVRTGEGDDAAIRVGRLVVGAGGAVTFQEIEGGDNE